MEKNSAKRFGKEGHGTEAGKARLESLLKDSGEKAFNFAFALAGNTEEAKELVQEAFYRVARAWESYDASKPLENWFLAILRNTFVDSRRLGARQVLSLDWPLGDDEKSACLGDTIIDDDGDILRGLEQGEAVLAVRRAMSKLSPDDGMVWRLCDLEGRDYE